MLTPHRRRRSLHQPVSPEDRYLGPGWERRARSVDGLLAIRRDLMAAYREDRVEAADVDMIAARVEWVDDGIGQLSRERAARRRTFDGRIRGAGIALVIIVLVLMIAVATGGPQTLITVGAFAVVIAVIVLVVNLVLAPVRSPSDDEPGLTDL